MPPIVTQALLSCLIFAAVFLLAKEGWTYARAWGVGRLRWYDRVLRQQLLSDIEPRLALGASLIGVMIFALLGYALTEGLIGAVIGGTIAWFLPTLVIRHLEQKRRERLENQLVDGVTTMASGVRAGLNLVQGFEMLAQNMTGPIKQEFEQLLREYQMGVDINQAMMNAADRIGLPNYRLLFVSLAMHRRRGGDVGESMDRIADSIREIQRLEGRLDALTAQGRAQASMMAGVAIVILLILYSIDPAGVDGLIADPLGRILLLVVGAMMLVGFLWIRRIMAVDI